MSLITNKATIDAIKKPLGGMVCTVTGITEALKKLEEVQKALSEHSANADSPTVLPIIAAGAGDLASIDDLSSIPWANDETVISLAFLGVKQVEQMSIRAIVLLPLIDLESIMEAPGGTDWLNKLVEKEMRLVSFRPLRAVEVTSGVDALYEAGKRLPTTAAEYIEENRRSGVDTSTFDAVWPGMRQALNAKAPALAKALPPKKEIIACIRSKSRALAEYPDLESQDIFSYLGKLVVKLADEMDGDESLDSAEIQSWLAGRDTLDLARQEREALTEKIDLSSLSIAG